MEVCLTTALLEETSRGFRRLSLSSAILSALDRVEYHEPTPIQAALVPHALAGRDVIGQAQTGTGKTAAFLLPFLNRWRDKAEPGPQALVLAPTRELVVQVTFDRFALDWSLRPDKAQRGQTSQQSDA